MYHLSIYVYVSACSSSLLTYRTSLSILQMCSPHFNFTRTFLNSCRPWAYLSRGLEFSFLQWKLFSWIPYVFWFFCSNKFVPRKGESQKGGKRGRTSIFAPTQGAKKVCQRLVVFGDLIRTVNVKVNPRRRRSHHSSLWCVLICPRQLIGLNHKTRLGTSSSCDSKFSISVRNTESSTVSTMRCCAVLSVSVMETTN
jgi:hypothetical protein